MTAVSRIKVNQARVVCAGHSLHSNTNIEFQSLENLNNLITERIRPASG